MVAFIIGKVVVKPSGPAWNCSKGVSFHDVNDVGSIKKAVQDLLMVLEVENSVLIEAFHCFAKFPNEKMEKYSFRWRTIVCRGYDNTAITSQMVCGINVKNKPINGPNTVPQTPETTFRLFGLDNAEVMRLKNTAARGSEKLMNYIINQEHFMPTDKRGGVGAQTDLIGIDFVIGEINGQLEPVGIEVNSHDCIKQCQRFEFVNKNCIGQSVRPLIKTMISRSQKFAMQGKTVVVIGVGDYSQQIIWDTYKNYGIKVVLVDPNETCYGSKLASHYINYDFHETNQEQKHATNIIKILQENNIPIDACVTMRDECSPLAATIASMLNLACHGNNGRKVSNMISKTHDVLLTRRGDIPHFPRTYLYATDCYKIETEADIIKALENVGFPAVLKLEGGSSIDCRNSVTDQLQCVNMYKKIKSNLEANSNQAMEAFRNGKNLVLMKHIDGSQHEVDVVIFKRQLIAEFITDIGPAYNKASEATASMPTRLPMDLVNELVTAAYQCCVEIGLIDGVFNVKMKMTSKGPKLIEINTRIGGSYHHSWIKSCYGVDILYYSFMISLGIRPLIKKPAPMCHIVGTMCMPSTHRDQLSDRDNLNSLRGMIRQGIVQYNQFKASFDECENGLNEEPFCNIAVMDTSINKAKMKLISVCNAIGVNHKNFDISDLLKDFEDMILIED